MCGLFYGSNKMATDVDVQYFSHLNGLTLGNNWGDLIRLLDKALVTGIDFTQITAASIDDQGCVYLTLYAAHQCMLLQVVELDGFIPSELNQRYRIKGIPSSNQLILKPKNDLSATSIAITGTAKLAPLGYDIAFRDVNDVKRVYRAQDPTVQHPFIRIDESTASDTGAYTSTYAKFAMVGLLEHMDHIDDFENPDILQLPFAPNDPAKNWRITGVGGDVVRGWSKWYWACARTGGTTFVESSPPIMGNRPFTLCGDKDSFYLMTTIGDINNAIQYRSRRLYGAGLFTSSLKTDVIPPWFLMTTIAESSASTNKALNEIEGGVPLGVNEGVARIFIPNFTEASSLSHHTSASPILPNYLSGRTDIFKNSVPGALEVPFSDQDFKLRGTLQHILFRGVNSPVSETTVSLANASMYIADCQEVNWSSNFYNAVNFYLGELE